MTDNTAHNRQLSDWQKAIAAGEELYRLVPPLPREETYSVRSQFTRAAFSIPADFAEGWVRESPKEEAHFLTMPRDRWPRLKRC